MKVIDPNTAMPYEINQLDTKPEEPQQEQQETQEPEEPKQEQVAEEPQETPSQMRFRELREKKNQAEWERDALARRVAELERTSLQSSKPAPQEEAEDWGIGEEDIIEGKHIPSLVDAIEKRISKKYETKFQRELQDTKQKIVENQIRTELSDIDRVVTKESLEALREMDPYLYQTVMSNPDLYSQSRSAYTLIKKFNLAPEKSTRDYSDNKARIQNNLSKPKAVQTVGGRSDTNNALGAAGDFEGRLTQSDKDRHYKEMMQAIHGRGKSI